MAKSMKSILIFITIVCLCLIFGLGIKSYAQPMISPADLKEQMQRHIEEMKIKSPKKYQAMMERAGGVVTKCTDCHKEVLERNIFPAPQPQK